MRHGLVRAAAYLPGYEVGGFRVRGPDEDAFTMGSAALERLVLGEHPPAPAGPVRLIAWGDANGVPNDHWQGVLGAPVQRIDVPYDRKITWGELVAAAGRGAVPQPSDPDSSMVVVGAIAPERGAGLPASGEGGYAFVLSEVPPGRTEMLESFAPEIASRDWPFALPLDPADPPTGVDLDVPSGRGPNPAVPGNLDAASTTRLSEGAYLPATTYREGWPSRWRFEGDRCGRCDATTFPVRGRCRRCGLSDGLLRVRLPRDRLRVQAVTWIGRGGQPTEFDDLVAVTGGYGVALAELAEGIRATIPLADVEPGSVRIGDRIDTRLRRLYALDGSWRYGRKGIRVSPNPDR